MCVWRDGAGQPREPQEEGVAGGLQVPEVRGGGSQGAPGPEAAREVIEEFTGQYRYLSNFWSCRVKWEGAIYPSTEHAYQAAKTLDLVERLPFVELPDAHPRLSCGKAKRAGRDVSLRDDWEDVKLAVMGLLVLQKFSVHEDLRTKLLATGELELQEGNDWGDMVWGRVQVSTHGGLHWRWVGENELGKTLMGTREMLRRAAGQPTGGAE